MNRNRRRARRIEADASVSVTSMMDMFTILLIYLLYFYDPNANTPTLELPSSAQKAENVDGSSLLITMDGVYLGDTLIISLANGEVPQNIDSTPLREALEKSLSTAPAKALSEQNTPSILTIRCDRRIPYASLGTILQTAGQAGYESYRFVVLHDAG